MLAAFWQGPSVLRGHPGAPQPLYGLQELLQRCLRHRDASAGGSLLLQPLSPGSPRGRSSPDRRMPTPAVPPSTRGTCHHVCQAGVGSCHNHCNSCVAKSNTGTTCLLIPKQHPSPRLWPRGSPLGDPEPGPGSSQGVKEVMATGHPAPGWRGMPTHPSQSYACPGSARGHVLDPRKPGQAAGTPTHPCHVQAAREGPARVNINPRAVSRAPWQCSSQLPSSTCRPAMRGLRARYHLLVGPAWCGGVPRGSGGAGNEPRGSAGRHWPGWTHGQPDRQGLPRGEQGAGEVRRAMGTLGTCPFSPAAP